jgi:hypothetical protein
MKAVVSKRELISHRKHLMISPPSKKMAETAQVTVSAAEQLSVTGPGFRHDMNCKAARWGTVRLPYKLWQHIIENLVPILNDKEIPISAENYQMQFGTTKIENPRIMVTRLDRLALEIPGDAKPIQIVQFALGHDFKEVRQSAVWKTVKAAIGEVRKQFERAAVPIKKYGITPQDIALLVAEELEIQKQGRFLEILFHDY